jgi:hypothetical protein
MGGSVEQTGQQEATDVAPAPATASPAGTTGTAGPPHALVAAAPLGAASFAALAAALAIARSASAEPSAELLAESIALATSAALVS